MLERRSALATAAPFSWAALTLGEVRGFALTQVCGFSKAFEAPVAEVAGNLPESNHLAIESQGRLIFRIGPRSFWFVGPDGDGLDSQLAGRAVITPLSNSRTRISVAGRVARQVLAKGIPLDLDKTSFGPGRFAMTGLHHTPILLHCVSPERFELYAMRTYALNIWEWLEDAALEFK